MIVLTPEIEAIVRYKAAMTGLTPEEILRDGLKQIGDVLPWQNSVTPPPENLSKDDLISAMEDIAVRSAARPIADTRSIDEIMGYDDFGLPR